jgi:hypothetical protein
MNEVIVYRVPHVFYVYLFEITQENVTYTYFLTA